MRKLMRHVTGYPGLVLFVCLGFLVGCRLSESGRRSARFVSKSTRSAARNAPPEKKPGMEAVATNAEQVSREAGEPREELVPIDFSKDTRLQQAVADANTHAEKYKKELEAKEALIASIKKWGGAGLAALLAALGIKGGFLLKLWSTAKKLRAAYDQKVVEVGSLVEGTQEVISQAKTSAAAVLSELEKLKNGGKITDIDWSKLKVMGEDAVKKIMSETQRAHGTWESLKGTIDEVKKYWAAGEGAVA